MVSWVVRSLLLCAAFGAVFCASWEEITIVKNLIETSNEFFRQHKREISLPDIGWIFEPIVFREGRLGEFDTLELISAPDIVSRVSHYGTVYTFNVSTALRDLAVHYKFHVNYPFFGKNGNVTITVRKKAFEMDGRVLVKHDGTCLATLQEAKVVQFSDFKVDFEPDDAPFITKIYQSVLNIIHEHMIPIINLAIRSETSKTSFRKHFNKLVCDEVTRNSTTEAPTTYAPTTFKPEPSPSTRRPYDPTTEEPEPYTSTRRPYDPTTEEPEPYTSTRRPYDPTTEEPEPYTSTRRPYDPTTEEPEPYTSTRRPYDPTTEEPEPSPSTRRPWDPTTEEPEPSPSTRRPWDPTTEEPEPSPSTRRPWDPTTEEPEPYTSTRRPWDPTTEEPEPEQNKK